MSRKPTITVIIPAYNAEKTITDTLNSVLAQTYPADKIIILDDGSTDRTVDKIVVFGDKVEYYRQENIGIAKTRNRLFAMVNTDLFAMIDSDDLWHKSYLEYQCSLHKKYPEIVASFVNFKEFRDNLNFQLLSEDGADKIDYYQGYKFLTEFMEEFGFALPSFCVIKKNKFEQLGNNPIDDIGLKCSEDKFLWYRLALLGPVFRSYKILGGYRISDNSLSNNRSQGSIDGVIAIKYIYTKYYKYAPSIYKKLCEKDFGICHRNAAKYCMSAGEIKRAKGYLKESLSFKFELKTLLFLILLFLPKGFHPSWPSQVRNLEI